MAESKKLSKEDLDGFTKQYMDSLYEHVSGYVSYRDGEKEEHAKKDIYLTYGEILPDSVDAIIESFEITKDDVFYDLGSGVGKVTMQVFMKTPIKEAVGIEFHAKRSKDARDTLAVAKEELPELFAQGRAINFIEGNFLHTDYSKSTFIFICATCYSEELMLKIGEKINDECHNLRYVFSLKQIPNCKLKEQPPLSIDCTWDKTDCYVYGDKPLIAKK